MKKPTRFSTKLMTGILYVLAKPILDFVAFWFNPKPKITAMPFKKAVSEPATPEQRVLTINVVARGHFKKRQKHNRAHA